MSPRSAASCRFMDHDVGTGRSIVISARTGAVIGGWPSIACWAASLPCASYLRVAAGVYAKPLRVMRGRPFAVGGPAITIVTAPLPATGPLSGFLDRGASVLMIHPLAGDRARPRVGR